jgi:hypothetical protein
VEKTWRNPCLAQFPNALGLSKQLKRYTPTSQRRYQARVPKLPSGNRRRRQRWNRHYSKMLMPMTYDPVVNTPGWRFPQYVPKILSPVHTPTLQIQESPLARPTRPPSGRSATARPRFRRFVAPEYVSYGSAFVITETVVSGITASGARDLPEETHDLIDIVSIRPGRPSQRSLSEYPEFSTAPPVKNPVIGPVSLGSRS